MRTLLLIFTIFLVISCQTLPPTTRITTIPQSYEVQGIIPIRQAYNGCAPAAIATILNFYGNGITQEEISRWIQGAYGSGVEETERHIRRLHFNLYRFYDYNPSKSTIKFFVSQGYPVLVVGQVRSENENHMVIIVGYDNKNSHFRIAEPQIGQIIKIQYNVFNYFHRAQTLILDCYCLVVWPR